MQTQEQLAKAAQSLAPQVVALLNKALLEAVNPGQAHATLVNRVADDKSFTRIYFSGRYGCGHIELQGSEWVFCRDQSGPMRWTLAETVSTTVEKVNRIFKAKYQA